jgi:hypothetical protein
LLQRHHHLLQLGQHAVIFKPQCLHHFCRAENSLGRMSLPAALAGRVFISTNKASTWLRAHGATQKPGWI